MQLSENPYPAAYRFAGLKLQPLDVNETVAALAARDPAEPFAAFVTPNVEHIYLCHRHPRMARVNDAAAVTCNDSRILGKAAKLAGLDLKFAPGSYVIPPLFDRFVKPDDGLTLIGGNESLAQALREKYDLNDLAVHIPPMGFIGDPGAVRAAVDFVVGHPARFVFLAMGPPQSELLCAAIMDDGRATGLGLCIGSSLQTLTGEINVAPEWMEKNSLVWLYRLLREPKRLWRRYLLRGGYGVLVMLKDILLIRLKLKDPRA